MNGELTDKPAYFVLLSNSSQRVIAFNNASYRAFNCACRLFTLSISKIQFPNKRTIVSIANALCLLLPAIGFCSKNGRLIIAKQVFRSMSKSSDSVFLNVPVVSLS